MSIKTTKRLALGVIASLVFAPLVAIAPASATTLTVSTITTSRAGTTLAPTIKIINAAAIVDTDILRIRIDSAPAGATMSENGTTADPDGTTVHQVLGNNALVAGTSGDTAIGSINSIAVAAISAGTGATITLGKVSAAGTYTFTAWLDDEITNAAGIGVLEAGEIYTTGSFKVGGAPTALSLAATSDATSIPATNTNYTVTLTDANSNSTSLAAGETILLAASTTAGSGDITLNGGAAAASPTSTLSGTTTTGKYAFNISAAAVGTRSVSANFGGTMSPLATAATATFTVVTEAYVTALDVKTGQTGVTTTANDAYAFPASPVHLNDGAVDNAGMVQNPATATVNYTLTGTASSWVKVVVANGTGTPVTAGTFIRQLSATGTLDFPVALSSTAAAGNTYTVTVSVDSNDDLSFTVTLNAASVQDETVTWSPNVEATNLTTVLALAGSTRSYTVTVADEFGTKYSNYLVQAVSTGSNAATTQAITDANGNATVTHVDAKAGAANDTLNFNVFAPGALSTDLEDKSLTVEYTTQAAYSLAVTMGATTDEALYTEAVTVADHVSVTPALASTAVGLAAKTGVLLKYTATGGVRLVAGNSTHTAALTTLSAASQTAVYAYGTTAGTGTVTVTTDLGHSVAKTFTVTANATKARLVTVTGSSATWGTASLPGKLTAKVTDGWNNLLSGVTVSWSREATSKAGRFAYGGSTTSCATDATGTCYVDVVGTDTEDGAFVASASLAVGTYAEYDDAAGSTVKAFAAGSGATANPTGTVSGSKYQAPYPAPTLQVVKDGGKILLSGTAVEGEGDIIVYLKKVGTTKWVEMAATIEVAAPGDYNGLRIKPKTTVLIRVKQEGTGLFSNQVVVRK